MLSKLVIEVCLWRVWVVFKMRCAFTDNEEKYDPFGQHFNWSCSQCGSWILWIKIRVMFLGSGVKPNTLALEFECAVVCLWLGIIIVYLGLGVWRGLVGGGLYGCVSSGNAVPHEVSLLFRQRYRWCSLCCDRIVIVGYGVLANDVWFETNLGTLLYACVWRYFLVKGMCCESDVLVQYNKLLAVYFVLRSFLAFTVACSLYLDAAC